MIIVAYLVVGGILVAGETVANAQKDVTILNEVRLNTHISIDNIQPPSSNLQTFRVTNDGNERISNFDLVDVFTGIDTPSARYSHDNAPILVVDQYSPASNNWIATTLPDRKTIFPNYLNPGQVMWITVKFDGDPPNCFQVTTSNGVNAQTTYP